MLASTFAKRYFDADDQPDPRTVRSWVEKGKVAGRVVGSTTYIDADAWEASTGNALADKIIGKFG